MSAVFNDCTRTAARPHQCYYCAQQIERGEQHGYRTGVTHGEFWQMRFHPECDDYARKIEWDYESHQSSDMSWAEQVEYRECALKYAAADREKGREG